MSKAIVIIGTGLAGYTLAREIRKRDSDVDLCLVTRDDGAFYSKPMLSNALAKAKTPDTLATANVDKMRADLNAEILDHATVTGIDTEQRRLQLGDGEMIDYGILVLAVGAQVIRPALQGDAIDKVFSINSLSDYRVFRERIEGLHSVAILGPGLIGCEFANDLVSAGYEVHVIGPDQWPLGRLLPPQAGAAVRDALEEIGVHWHLQRIAQAVQSAGDKVNVVMDNERQLQADIVLSAIGLRPSVDLAQIAGLRINRGIVVDRNLASSDPHIYALGDCAEVEGMVLPFVMPLMQQARALAATLTGSLTQVNYPAMPVLVKTTSYPVIVSPPSFEAQGEWEEDVLADGVKAVFKSGDRLLGFALTGSAVGERMALTKLLPMVMP